MKRLPIFVFCIAVFVGGPIFAADEPPRTKYFATVSGTIPLALSDELAQPDAIARDSYYEGIYDPQGRLIGVREVSRSGSAMFHAYKYDASGSLVEAKVTTAKGKVSLYRRDGAGQLQLVPTN